MSKVRKRKNWKKKVKNITSQSKRQANQHRELTKISRSDLKDKIDNKITEILTLISNFEPLELLSALSIRHCFTNPETYCESTSTNREWYVEYALSLVLCQKRNPNVSNPSDEVIDRFASLIEEIFRDVTNYFGFQSNEDNLDSEEAEIRIMSILRYLSIRGDSYHEHHIEIIKDIFTEHDDFLNQHFGITTNEVIVAIQQMGDQLQNNVYKKKEAWSLVQKSHEIFKEFIENKESNSNISLEEYRVQFLQLQKVKELDLDNKLEFLEDSIFEIVPDGNISINLLDLLSSELGDNDVFLQFAGSFAWPTNDSIIYDRPIIKEDGKYYLFNFNLLFQNVGDILERLIQRGDNSYYQDNFQKGRAKYLENKSLEYFKSLLPDAEVYGKLFYSLLEDGKEQREETDGLVLFDENLIIIEAKSGGLSRSARRGSLERIRRDMRKLVQEAYTQAIRTKQYIDIANQPTFKNEHGSTVLVINEKDKFKNIFLVNVTRECLGHLATRLNSARKINLLQGKEWPWSVFINDLRVISEIIEFPSEFLNFLQRRIRVNDHPQFHTTDELDFFMYYLSEGLYFEDGANIGKSDFFVPVGYTEKLDRYYLYRAGLVSNGEKPILKISEDYKMLVAEIESLSKNGFTRVTTTLLSLDIKTQDEILTYLKKESDLAIRDGQPHQFLMLFKKMKMGLVFWVSPNFSLAESNQIDWYCKMKKYQTKMEQCILVLIFLNKDGSRGCDFRIYDKVWKYDPSMEEKIAEFKAQNLAKFRALGKKVYRNDPCPCNSGLKYKICCGK